MKFRFLIGAAAVAIAIGAAVTFTAVPSKRCTGNVMQDDLITCGINIGEGK